MSRTSSQPAGSSDSTSVIARASARLSPPTSRSAIVPSAIAGQTTFGPVDSVLTTRRAPREALPAPVRGEPPPRHGGPPPLLRFLREHGMLTWGYARLALRLAWLKL